MTSIISATFLAGKFTLAMRKKLTVPICETGAKSLDRIDRGCLYSAGLMPSVVLWPISSV